MAMFTKIFSAVNVILVATIIGFSCRGETPSNPVDVSSATSLGKGRGPLPNLKPVDIDHPVRDLYGTYFTGYEIPDHDSSKADLPCVVWNDGDTTFVAVAGKNEKFIVLRWGTLDTLTSTFTNVRQYTKNDFDPWGACILDSVCGRNYSGLIATNSFDIYRGVIDSLGRPYFDVTDSLRYGIIVFTVQYGRNYPEKSYTDNDLTGAFIWKQNMVCNYPDGHDLACYNGTMANRYVTQKVITKLRNSPYTESYE